MSKTRFTIFILLMIVIGQAAIDIYLPSLPAMVHSLHTTSTLVQLSLTMFLIGFSVSQLFYGPMSDHYGRKPIELIGLSIFLIATIICALAQNIETLFIARIIQGLGVGASSVMSRAVSRDVFDGKELAKVSSYVAIAWSTIPIVAPLLGSYIQTYLGWRFNFVFLAFIDLLLIVAIIVWLPETLQKKSSANRPSVINSYKELLLSKLFIRYILCVLIVYGICVDFNITAPFLLQDVFHLSAIAYGWWIVFVAIGYMIGSYCSSRLVDHLFFNLFFIGILYPQCIAGSLSPFPHIAGSAGAMFGFMVFLGGTIASLIISHLPEFNAIPVATMILVQAVLVMLSYRLLKPKKTTAQIG